jgi:CheY-like chemotaxis protein
VELDIISPLKPGCDKSKGGPRDTFLRPANMEAHQPTILVVDDDANDRYFTLSAFEHANATANLQSATGGMAALEYLKGEGKYADRSLFPYPDFILTDLKMPAIDGFSILTYLKEDPKAKFARTAVLSGSSNNQDVQRCLRLGAISYHIKPSGTDALRALIKVLHDYWMACEIPRSEEIPVIKPALLRRA